MLAAAVAWAHHGRSFEDGPVSLLTAALAFAGLALLVGAIVVILIAVLTRRPETPPDSGE